MNAVMTSIREYWHDLSDREQILLAIMSALLGFVIIHFLIARPLLDYHERSRDAYVASMRLYRSIEADALTYRELSAGAVRREATSQQSMRSIVGSLALTNGIAIARLVPGDDGSLTVSIEEAETAAVMQWLRDLDSRFGIRVHSSTMDRASDERLQASLVLRRAGDGS